MKKISKIFAMIVLFLALVFSAMTPSMFKQAKASGADEITIQVLPGNKDDKTGHCIPSVAPSGATKSNDVIIFQCNDDIDGSVTIYYTTVDRSAIASSGDYQKTSGSVTLTNTNKKVPVYIEVYTTKFASKYEEKTYTRDFAFDIVGVVYEKGKAVVSTKEIICDVISKHTLTVEKENTSAGSFYYYKGYKYEKSQNQRSQEKVVGAFDIDTFRNFFGTNEYEYWVNDYVNTGLADVYAGFRTENLVNSCLCSTGDVKITLIRNNNGEKLTHLYYDYGRLWHVSTNYFDQTSGHMNKDLSVNNYGHPEKTCYIPIDGSNQLFRGIKLTDSSKDNNAKENLKLNYEVNNDISGTVYSVRNTVVMDEILLDDTTPVLQQAYFDGDHAYIDGKVRVSIRYSEPVQIYNNSSLFARIQFGSYTVNFQYESGAMTDTLVFSADIASISKSVSSDIEYSAGSLVGIYENASDVNATSLVGDMALRYGEGNQANYCNRATGKVTTSQSIIKNFHLDLHSPTVRKTVESYTGPIASRTVRVNVQDCTNGTLYYVWSEKAELDIAYIRGMSNYQGFLNQFTNTEIVRNEDSTQKIDIQSLDKDGNLLHGSYYLHTFVESQNGKGAYERFGSTAEAPYVFDSVAPVVGDISAKSGNNPKSRTYNIGLTDDGEGVSKIELIFNKVYGEESRIEIWKEGDSDSIYDGTTLNLTITPEMLGLVTNEYGYFDFSLYAVDKCGNETVKEKIIQTEFFDMRELFEVSQSKVKGNDALYSTSLEEEVYCLTSDTEFLFSHNDDAAVKYSVEKLVYGGVTLIEDHTNKVTAEELSEYVTISVDGSKKITIYPKKEGKMIVSFNIDNSRYTKDHSFYFTKDYLDKTTNGENILSSQYAKSYVYQLSTNKFTYLVGDLKNGIKQESYGDTTLPLVFSDYNTAYSYVEYMEKQDMSLIVFDESHGSIINNLNHAGNVEYVKADHESMEARVGQSWIRYKIDGWTYDNQKWAYYYYGEGAYYQDINVSLISTLLSNAIKNVSERITKLGGYTYLVDEEYQNASGQLKVNEAQIQDKNLSTNTTRSGNAFTTAITYHGDEAIYCSEYRPYSYDSGKVKFDTKAEAIKFVMQYNIQASEDTRLYYYSIPNNTTFSYEKIPTYKNEWVEMSNPNGRLFDSYFAKNASGIFVIMEMDKKGVYVFQVYIDHLAPELNIEYRASSSDTTLIPDTLNYSSDNKTLGVNQIIFKTFNTSEGDPYSYISIYKANYSQTYLGTYMLSDLLSKEINLTDGAYILKVSDRFGNTYTTRLNYNTTELVVEVGVSADQTYFYVTCNREEDQIYEYTITRGNEVIKNTYSKTTKIYNSGNYVIRVRDIYGNEFVYSGEDGTGFYFQKALPKVTWRYDDGTGNYIAFKKGVTGQPMNISPSEDDSTFYIATAVNLQFVIESGTYAYEFTSGNPSNFPSQGNGSIKVAIESTSGWTLKIWYEKYPEVYVIYTCDVDNQAPDVLISYQTCQYTYEDDAYLKNIAKTHSGAGDIIEGQSYKFIPSTEDGSILDNYVRSGDVVQAESFNVKISDDNKVNTIVVTKDGEEITPTISKDSNGHTIFTLEGYGVYKIIATDIFGNSTNVQFTNSELVKVNHYVDDESTDSNENYGNLSDVLSISSDGSVLYIINDTQYNFFIVHGELYYCKFVTAYENSILTWGVAKYRDLFVNSESKYVDGTWYKVEDIKDNIFYMHTSEGFMIKVCSQENGRTIINYSVLLENGSKPIVYNSVLSEEKSDIKLEYKNGEEIKTNQNEEMILIYDEFVIDEDSIDKDTITRIRISYSKTTSFTYFTTIYNEGQDFIDYLTSRDGFYAIEITNKFGNVLKYYLNKSDSMQVITTVTYSDGSKNVYSNDYTEVIYSNNQVVVTVYTTNGKFEITRCDQTYEITPEVKGDTLSITIHENGEYIVKVKDEYGNTQIRSIEIDKNILSVPSDVIYGYNEEALWKNQGYTNKKLSIDFDKAVEAKVSSIYIVSDMGTQIVYDKISETKVEATTESLKNVIGTLGTGEYKVIFRDKYGNNQIKVIHYNEDGTINVEMNYRTSLDYVTVTDFDKVWSNNAIRISTTSERYLFYVDGNRAECPLTLSFNSYDGSGQKDYEITYQDEYGFKYSFKVHLLRQDIDVGLKGDIKTKTINGVITTKDDIVIKFPEDTICYYTINGVGKYNYTENQKIVNDAVYTFVAEDKAGNVGTYTIEKDTTVEYKFSISATDFVLMNGGVSNSTVEFRSLNKDTSYIYLVMKDGEELKDGKSMTKFTEAGEYQVLIVDEMGNESAFSFTLITHKLASFEYKVPYNYAITDAWITPKAGFIMSYMDKVDSETGFNATDDGYYTITLTSLITGAVYSFNFTVDSTPPDVSMVGVEDNGSTTNDISFKGTSVGDTIYIYKDGKLVKTFKVTANNDTPVISEGGVYRIVVKNEAGVKTTYNFTRAKILNSAGSALVMVGAGVVMLALFIGLLFRRRSKIDK